MCMLNLDEALRRRKIESMKAFLFAKFENKIKWILFASISIIYCRPLFSSPFLQIKNCFFIQTNKIECTKKKTINEKHHKLSTKSATYNKNATPEKNPFDK